MAVGGYYGHAPAGSGARRVWRPVPLTPQAAPAAGPIPAPYYNPGRDVEEREGKAGSEQASNRLLREQGYGNTDYALGLDRLKENRSKSLRDLGESFKRLGSRQGEGINASGTFLGGAALQAAAKRATNEGRRKGDLETGYRNEEGDLTLRHERQNEGFTEALTNNTTNAENFLKGIETYKGKEAADNGYELPRAPRPLRGGVKPYFKRSKAGFVNVRG